MSVYLSVCLSVCLSACLSVSQSVLETDFILPEMKAKPSPRTVFQDLCALSLFNCGYPLSPNRDLRAGGSGAWSLVSTGLSRSSQCRRDDVHVSHHNLCRCSAATLPHHIHVMSTTWRGSPKRHHTGLRGAEKFGPQIHTSHSAFNCPCIVPPGVFTVQARRLPRFSPRVHCHSSPPHPCDEY